MAHIGVTGARAGTGELVGQPLANTGVTTNRQRCNSSLTLNAVLWRAALHDNAMGYRFPTKRWRVGLVAPLAVDPLARSLHEACLRKLLKMSTV
jgi:hypothetical protein